MGLRDRGIEIKTPEQIALMRVAGLLVGRDARAPARRGRGRVSPPASSTPSPRTTSASHGGDPVVHGLPRLPGPICASVNDEVVHGIPGDRVLAEGDLISIDCGAIVDGWHGDAAITVAGRRGRARGDRADARSTEEALWRGFAAARLGGRVSDISHAVETNVRAQGDVRDPRGLRRARDRLGDAPAAERAQLRPTAAAARSWSRVSRSRSSRWSPSAARDTESSRTTGPWSPPTVAGRALRAHLHPDPGRRLGADRLGRRRGPTDRPRCAVRWPLTLGLLHASEGSPHERRALGLVDHDRVTSAILLVDVFVIGRRPHEPSMRESIGDLSLFVGAAVVFGIGVWMLRRRRVRRRVLRRLADRVLPLDRQPVHLHHHHEQVRRAAAAAADGAADRDRARAGAARRLHRRRRGGDRAVQLGLLPLRRSSWSAPRSTSPRRARGRGRVRGDPLVALGTRRLPGHRGLGRREAQIQRERRAADHPDVHGDPRPRA